MQRTGQSCAPVALFVYNRPVVLESTLMALSANPLADKSDLVVFSDGPKGEGDREAVEQVRERVRRIRGFRSVRIVESEDNQGLQCALTSGISRMCREYGRVIVLEDDVKTAPDFLAFMNWALDTYEDEERVYAVSTCWPCGKGGDACFFVQHFEGLGWGTWRRAWEHYDADAVGLERLRRDMLAAWRFDLEGKIPMTRNLLSEHTGSSSFNWDLHWDWAIFRDDALVLFSPCALSTVVIERLDVHAATHGNGGFTYFFLKEQTMGSVRRLDPAPVVAEDAERRDELGNAYFRAFIRAYPLKGFLWRILRRLRRLRILFFGRAYR